MSDNLSDKIILTTNDLSLLMEAYKNNVELSTTLLEQQKKVLEKQDDIIEREQDILDKQITICENLNEILDRLSQCAVNTIKIQSDIISNLNSNKNEIVSDVSDIKTELINYRLENTKECNSIKKSLFGIYAIVSGVIIGLLGLIIDLSFKSDLLQKILAKLGG